MIGLRRIFSLSLSLSLSPPSHATMRRVCVLFLSHQPPTLDNLLSSSIFPCSSISLFLLLSCVIEFSSITRETSSPYPSPPHSFFFLPQLLTYLTYLPSCVVIPPSSSLSYFLFGLPLTLRHCSMMVLGSQSI